MSDHTTPAAFVAAWFNANPLPPLIVEPGSSPEATRLALMATLTAMLEAYVGPWRRARAYWHYLRQFATHGKPDPETGLPTHWCIAGGIMGQYKVGYATVDEAIEAQVRLEEEARRAD